MDSRLLATIIIFPIWITLIIIFRRHRQWLLYYLVASFGLTLQLVFLAEHFGFDQTLVNMATFHIKLIMQFLFKIQMVLLSNGRFQLVHAAIGSDILKLGIECSAVLESSIVLSLIIFYPLFNIRQKILRAGFGLVMTYVINIVRLIIIVLITNKFGSDYIFLAHAGVARVFFFVAELFLYWYLITKPTVRSVGDSLTQKVPLENTARVGASFRYLNAGAQVAVIIIVVGLGFLSFRVSNEWKLAFAPAPKVERPLIYPEETGIDRVAPDNSQPRSNNNSAKNKDILGAEEAVSILHSFGLENLNPGQTQSYQYIAKTSAKLNLRIVEGAAPLKIKIYRNGLAQNITDIDLASNEAPIINQKVFYMLVSVASGDRIDISFENLGRRSSNYKLEIIKEKQEQF